ncbi:TPA: hypothetical protein ACH3X3_010720 [Trebouxia sp. C0006]
MPEIKLDTNTVRRRELQSALQAEKKNKIAEQHALAKASMTSWLVKQKCLLPCTIPFRKSPAEQARLKSTGDLLATALRPWACLCIGLKDAQTHYLLSSKDMEGISAGSKRRQKSQVAHPHKVYNLQDVQAAACRLYTDAAGLKAATEAHQLAKAQKQADAVVKRADAA